jgi:hypothetical protein
MAKKKRPKDFPDFNEQTIDDIVAKTGYPVADKAALLEDLLNCYDRAFPLFPQRPKGTIKQQQDRWNSIRKHITRLLKLIEEDDADLSTVRKILEDLGEAANTADQDVVREMTGLWCDLLIGMLRGLALQLERGEMEPAEFIRRIRERYGVGVDEVVMQKLTGEWLVEIFEKHFNREAGRSRPVNKGGYSGPPTGPYIRFAKAVLAAWKLDYSKESIYDALRPAEIKI